MLGNGFSGGISRPHFIRAGSFRSTLYLLSYLALTGLAKAVWVRQQPSWGQELAWGCILLLEVVMETSGNPWSDL